MPSFTRATSRASSMKGLRPIDRARYQKRVQARAGAWVDRLASAWLIKRFIDRDAKFAWIARPSNARRKRSASTMTEPSSPM